jgi:hypothetical protein
VVGGSVCRTVDWDAEKRETPTVDPRTFVEQLRSIERQYAPPDGTDASAYVRQLEAWRRQEADREEACSTSDATGAWLFLRLCALYGIKPFRHARQKPTTITIRAPRNFISKVLWPQHQAMRQVFIAANAVLVDELVVAWLGREAADTGLRVGKESNASE